MNALLRELIAESPDQLDLTSAAHLEMVRVFADRLLAEARGLEALDRAERELLKNKAGVPLLAHLVAKVARSRQMMLDLAQPAHVSVLFAVYKEHQRILPSAEIQGGEDFLRRKVQQLDWLCAGTKLTWDLTVVDDGCPENSGGIAQEIIEAEGWGDQVQVLYLAEALKSGHPLSQRLQSPADSMKGGSIQLGMGEAARNERDDHVVVFTDADLSTHLGQTGLLVRPIVAEGKDAAIGSRREPGSVVVKQGSRNDRGKLFIYLWKRMVGCLPHIIDTQCGFKGFRAETVRRILPDMIEQKFAFDIELLIRTELHRSGSIGKVAVAWIDSEELSTTTDIQPYLPMLQQIAAMYRKYLPANPEADSFARLADALDEDAWRRLQENIPAAITSREPLEFEDFAGVQAEELKKAAGLG